MIYAISLTLDEYKLKQQYMSASLMAGIETVRQGLNYLVPTKWWNEFYALNKQMAQLQSIKVPPLNLSNFVDDFLINYQSQLIESIQEKCHYLTFHQVKISPEINQVIEWTPINPELWKPINKKLKEKNAVMTFVDRSRSIDVKKALQLQLIYCSKTRSQLFVGYMPKHANLIATIREIGFELGFIQVTRSKITFVERSPQVCFSFHELQKYTVESSPDIFLMMFNMERNQDEEQKFPLKTNGSFGPFVSNNNTPLNESNEAVVGDLITMSDDSRNHLINEPIHNRTMSTGAQTPFSFGLSEGFDLDRQYRVNELFGAKEPEQIQQMRQCADKKISNQKDLINVSSVSSEGHKAYLQRLAEQMCQSVAKRKVYKEKEVQSSFES